MSFPARMPRMVTIKFKPVKMELNPAMKTASPAQ